MRLRGRLSRRSDSMATMTISLPESVKDWVEAQAHTGRYADASDYLRDLIERDQERAAKLEEMQRLITDGLESGISDRSMQDILEAAREHERDAAVERWLRDEFVPVAAAMEADPGRAIPAETVFAGIRALHAQRLKDSPG